MSDLIWFYWRLLLRRAPVMFAIVLLFCVISVVYAVNLTDEYEAEARLLVEPAQIPDELAASTVSTDMSEQLQIIQQRLMRRANLLELAHKHDVFGPEQAEMSPNEISSAMSQATTINTSNRRNQATFMDISFTARDPDIAASVVNDLVTRTLDDNIRMRTQQAGKTLEFFEDEVERLSQALSRQSAKISEFKSANSNSLPEALNFRLGRESTLEERLASLRRERTALEEQRERVVSVYEGTGQLRTPEAQLTPEQRQLRDLETELSSALAVYSETNPRVTVLQTRIDQLRKVVAGQSSDGDPEGPSTSVYDVTLAEIDAKKASLDQQIDELVKELASLREMIEKTPQTAIELDALERDYQIIQSQYNGAVQSLSRARTGEQIELTAQGQRISVVENAIVPEWPTSPNRKLIVAAGGLAGVAAAVGFFALLEVLNSSIRRPGELVARVGIAPLATLPRIETRRQRIARRSLQALAVLVFFVIAPASLFAVHEFVMPLNEVFEAAKDVITNTAERATM